VETLSPYNLGERHHGTSWINTHPLKRTSWDTMKMHFWKTFWIKSLQVRTASSTTLNVT
jgi:hypothetical protein